jgi:hypothetical protein
MDLGQQNFQTLVYEHLYTIISFLILFSQYASGYGFCTSSSSTTTEH